MENLKEVRAMRINGRLMASGKIKSLNERRREEGLNNMKVKTVEKAIGDIDTSMFGKIRASKLQHNKELEHRAYDKWLHEKQVRESKISYKISSIFKAIAKDLHRGI